MTKATSQSTNSLWDYDHANLPVLSSNQKTDVCIVGAGISGLTTGYMLSRAGFDVTIVDASHPGTGETGNTTAHLASALDDGFIELEKLFGEEGSFLAADSHRKAIDTIEQICQRENIYCQFKRLNGYLFSPLDHDNFESTRQMLEAEFEAAHRAGFDDISLLDTTPFLSKKTDLCIEFPNQAQIHPLLYLQGLRAAFLKSGGKLFINSEVINFEESKPACVVTTAGFKIDADHLIIATNTPINDRFIIHTKQAAYRTYAMSFEMDVNKIPQALFWDTLDPYHYVRSHVIDETSAALIVGGEDHKTGQDEASEYRFENLEAWTREYFPDARKVLSKWSGQVLEPVDSLAFIGRNPGSPDNVYIVTGDSGHGFTHGTIAGLLLNDLVQGHDNPWRQIYDPARKNLHLPSVKEYIKENFNTALQYASYVMPGEYRFMEDIPVGEGGNIKNGIHNIAVYHKSRNSYLKLSAVCPHLNGIVHWNNVEKTWDCPCHGSRFDSEGNIMNGPSTKNLTIIEEF